MAGPPTQSPPKRAPYDPQELRERVKGVANKLYGLSRRGPGRHIADPLLEAIEELRVVWAGLRRLSLVRDLTGVKALLGQEHELRQAVETLKGTLNNLSHSNTKATAIIDEQVHGLEELEIVDSDERVAERLRALTGGFRQAAHEMKQGIDRSRADVETSERIVASVDRRLMETRQEAERDGLTQLLSRAAFEERLAELAAQLPEGTGRWCVAIAEVDQFAPVNDEYGERVADALLFRVAEVIQRASEPYADTILARYDDEQFGLLFSHHSLRQAYRVAEDVREAVGAAKWECKASRPPKVVSTSISVGLAEFSAVEGVERLLARVETCLERAREAGRDVVAVDG